MDTNSTVTATASPKSLGVALVLALLLGPIGLLYATVMGGVVLLVADLIALFVLFAAAPVGILLFVAIQIAAVIWAIKALTSQNAELLGQLPPGVATANSTRPIKTKYNKTLKMRTQQKTNKNKIKNTNQTII